MFSNPPITRAGQIVNTEPPATSVSAPCSHCGSAKTQTAIRTAAAITFRCLHCWKTFTRPVDAAQRQL